MSTALGRDVEVAVIGGGVVGCATTLALARRDVSVALLEAEPEPALAASATNSGILHTGFDSPPGELETEMLRDSRALREPVLETLAIPVLRCGAVIRAPDPSALAALARRGGVEVHIREDGTVEIPDEAVTDPVIYTLALAAAARRGGALLLTCASVEGIDWREQTLTLRLADGASLRCAVAVNCAGLQADAVARLVGDESFEIYPRKGEFLVFEPPPGEPLDRILLPVHTQRTRGVLVFPTIDGKIVAGPTAVDQDDKHDWAARPNAADEIVPQATRLYPPLEGATQIAAYVGLRPAGRGVNYLIAPARPCPRLVNVAAIRSTGLSASLGIAQRVARIVAELGVALQPERELEPAPPPRVQGPWWRRTADYRAPAA